MLCVCDLQCPYWVPVYCVHTVGRSDLPKALDSTFCVPSSELFGGTDPLPQVKPTLLGQVFNLLLHVLLDHGVLALHAPASPLLPPTPSVGAAAAHYAPLSLCWHCPHQKQFTLHWSSRKLSRSLEDPALSALNYKLDLYFVSLH